MNSPWTPVYTSRRLHQDVTRRGEPYATKYNVANGIENCYGELIGVTDVLKGNTLAISLDCLCDTIRYASVSIWLRILLPITLLFFTNDMLLMAFFTNVLRWHEQWWW